ncbi:DUF3237 domain-containing protein [Altericroceibacterium xinjiangense]|uniref:DUF3237 domain-containing protein n=1 Tax=Altericroceibacterium xinjiangense TaxID=762261 RepID=UPI000F7E19AA|nr:DUF3237 domain-containing protein [Altericroceibacterium xinjiangense]
MIKGDKVLQRFASIVAGGACLVAAPAAAQQPPSLDFAFTETVTLADAISVGNTTRGERFIIPITGGTVEGPGIRGTVLPGGWDWQLVRPDGCKELVADYFIKTDDEAIINVVNEAVLCPTEGGEPAVVRTQATFEPPLGKYEWLGRSPFVGVLEAGPGGEEGGSPSSIKISFYRVR